MFCFDFFQRFFFVFLFREFLHFICFLSSKPTFIFAFFPKNRVSLFFVLIFRWFISFFCFQKQHSVLNVCIRCVFLSKFENDFVCFSLTFLYSSAVSTKKTEIVSFIRFFPISLCMYVQFIFILLLFTSEKKWIQSFKPLFCCYSGRNGIFQALLEWIENAYELCAVLSMKMNEEKRIEEQKKAYEKKNYFCRLRVIYFKYLCMSRTAFFPLFYFLLHWTFLFPFLPQHFSICRTVFTLSCC